MSKITVDTIEPSTGTTITLGGSGDTLSVPSGVTLNVASGGTITNSGSMSGFGKVLQVVNATKSDTNSTTSGTAVTTGLEASITPSATSSKVLVLVSFAYSADSDSNSVFQLYRDSTAIHLGDAASNRVRASAGTLYVQNSAVDVYSASINCLDTPSTTSSITYALYYFRGNTSTSNPVYFNRSHNDADTNQYKRAISSITLMEIAG